MYLWLCKKVKNDGPEFVISMWLILMDFGIYTYLNTARHAFFFVLDFFLLKFSHVFVLVFHGLEYLEVWYKIKGSFLGKVLCMMDAS